MYALHEKKIQGERKQNLLAFGRNIATFHLKAEVTFLSGSQGGQTMRANCILNCSVGIVLNGTSFLSQSL